MSEGAAIPAASNGKRKGSEAEAYLAHSRNSKDDVVSEED